MSLTPSLQQKIEETTALAAPCLAAPTVQSCTALDHAIREIDALARETFQAALRDTYAHIAEKLEGGRALSDEEEKAVELLIVGDAKYYTEAENNVEDWKHEVGRLMERLSAVGGVSDNPLEQLLRLRALCRDAMSVLPDLMHYVAELDRLARYRQGAASGDPERGKVLARAIRAKLEAPDHCGKPASVTAEGAEGAE
jgi:hypothetical protein